MIIYLYIHSKYQKRKSFQIIIFVMMQVFSMVRGMTSQEADNACLYSSKTGFQQSKNFSEKKNVKEK